MNKKIKRAWIKDLRSGRFEQGYGLLCRIDKDGNHSYCCLGVLYETLWEMGYPIKYKYLKQYNSEIPSNHCEVTLTEKIRKITGITDAEVRTLTRMNDTEGRSFKEIANYIEKNL